MSNESLITKIQEMLNEEKWTRATLGAYSINHLKELDVLLEEVHSQKADDEVRSLCAEHLVHSKSSIIALYISGLISLVRQEINDSSLLTLIELFADNKKWNIVEFVCQRMLDFGESKLALRHLAHCYEIENRAADKFAVWERLVRVDHDEADIVKALAEHYDAEGNKEVAIEFYKKALYRYIAKDISSSIKELWSKLLESCPEEIDFFYHVQGKIAKQISKEKAAGLLLDLYKYHKAKGDWNVAIDILRLVIEYDEHNQSLRHEIIECYKGKYAGHSHLDEYIRLSNIDSGYRSIQEAMGDFEKHIAFDVGNFVFHRTWQVGRIKTIAGEEIVIDFAKKRGHAMSLKMAIDSLTTLSKDHIWVLKSIWTKEKLYDKIKNDLSWALNILIRSFDNRTDLKRIKTELVPSVLSQTEWTTWSSKARKLLREDPMFGHAQDAQATFIVRDRPLTSEEKVYNQFKAEKNFFVRIQLFRDFLDEGETGSEYFTEMLGYFTSLVRSYQKVDAEVLASYLLLKELATEHSFLKGSVTLNFTELFNHIPNVVEVYNGLKDAELRRAFLQHVRTFISNWALVYVKLFPYCLNTSMLETLKANGHEKELRDMVLTIGGNYREHREAFIWMVKNLKEEQWFKDAHFSPEKIIITLINIIELSLREIDNRHETTDNRKINKQAQAILFGKPGKEEESLNDENSLINFLQTADLERIERIYTLLMSVKDLDPAIKLRFRNRIVDKHPNFKAHGEEARETVSHGLMVTAAKYEEKRKLLEKILDVEVPANQKEIAYALSLGDLRENAEYKAAKEKQDELNAKVAKLKNEIERAQLFDKTTINTSKISFGTRSQLKNLRSGEIEPYTLLGPWESEPSKNIISYLSPLGKKLLNHGVGDRLTFTIHDNQFEYEVLSIEAVKF